MGYATQREVPALSIRLLKKHPEIASEIAYRFPVIMVDEAQDTSREQMEIIELLGNKGAITVVIVGDPDQAIYEWRDATPEFFTGKLCDPNWTSLYLTANFRSSQHICNASAKFSNVLSGKKPAEAKCEHSGYEVKPVLLQFTSNNQKSDVISWFKQLCISKGINPDCDSVAILTRGRIHSNTNIPDLWQTAETHLLALASYLRQYASRKEAYLHCEKALFNMMVGQADGLSAEEIKLAIENTMAYSTWKKNVIMLLSSLPKPSFALKDWKNSLIEIIEEFRRQGIITISGSRDISDIIKLKTRVKIGKTFSSDFLNYPLHLFFEKRTVTGTTFSSVHGVKGESFEAILLMVESNSGNTITPSNLNSGDLDSELMRIAYVAMTRPRKLLVVSIPKQKAKNGLVRFPPELWDYQEI
jgi:superfamily I DNA/RNA helicase